jgi:hypothetical protein
MFDGLVEKQQRSTKSLQDAFGNGFFNEYLVQSFKTSDSLDRGPEVFGYLPELKFIPIPKQVGLKVGGIDFEELI